MYIHRDDFRQTARYNGHLLVLEWRVGYGDDEAFLQEWLTYERPLSNHLFSDELSLGVLVRVLQMHNHLCFDARIRVH